MASEIWSATLSGWPSETDSEVKRKSFDTLCSSAEKNSPARGWIALPAWGSGGAANALAEFFSVAPQVVQ
jgi:hypothetical protein